MPEGSSLSKKGKMRQENLEWENLFKVVERWLENGYDCFIQKILINNIDDNTSSKILIASCMVSDVEQKIQIFSNTKAQ